MEQKQYYEKVTAAAHTIFSYCMSRTRTMQDAEDLSQEILCALLQSSANLRNDDAFYGFMWSVAGNVCRAWYRRKAREGVEIPCEDMVSVSDNAGICEDSISADDDAISLLRRELSILSEKYRRAAVLYYVHGKSCHEIARILSANESMVKYLLFQSRNILREGMQMERTYGVQSYDPKTLSLYYSGEGPNRFWDLMHAHKIRQNILWACHHDALCAQEIALQIGVSLPYLEDDIRILTEAGLLQKTGKRYRTNLIILTAVYEQERAPLVRRAADALAACMTRFIDKNADAIRAIGFRGNGISAASLRWQMTAMLLDNAFLRTKTTLLANLVYPVTAFGEHAYVWGVEQLEQGYNHSAVYGAKSEMYFMDWAPCKASDHHVFFGKQQRIRLYEKLMSGYDGILHETEEEEAAELLRLGYLCRQGSALTVTMPVFTKEQYAAFCALSEETEKTMAQHMTLLAHETVGILKNHVPTHLKQQVDDIAVMSMFDAVTAAPTHVLLENGYLSLHYTPNEIATAYAVLH